MFHIYVSTGPDAPTSTSILRRSSNLFYGVDENPTTHHHHHGPVSWDCQSFSVSNLHTISIPKEEAGILTVVPNGIKTQGSSNPKNSEFDMAKMH